MIFADCHDIPRALCYSGLERKLLMLSATGISPFREQHSTASPNNTTLALLSHNPFLWLRLLSFRSPLLRQSLLLSFPLTTTVMLV